MADKEELISSFCTITGVDNDRAKFFLESAAWNLDLSIASFYEESDELERMDDDPIEVPIQPAEPTVLEKREMQTPTRSASNNKIMTFAGLTKDDSSDDEENHQTFYAGGSERSGQQVLGPGKKKTPGNNIISEMFKSAKESGAEVLDPHSAQSTSRGGNYPSQAFRGTGYKLGSTENDTEVVGIQRSVANTTKPPPREMVLRLWKNGFSVDGGALRDFEDPANKDFLDSIKRGEIPRELVRHSQGAEISLNMEDHHHEDFKVTKERAVAFGGEGFRLGSPAPLVVSDVSREGAIPISQNAFKLDPDKDQTQIQIRLTDGKKVTVKVNYTHTIGDIRSYINQTRPEYAGNRYSLMTTFPNKELTNENQTIQEEGLINAVIVQRLK